MSKYYIYCFDYDYDNTDKVVKVLTKIVSSGKGKYFNSEEDRIISCYEKIEIDGEIFEPRDTLVDYISYYGGNGYTISMEYGMEFELDEVADILFGDLDKNYKDSGKTYSDIIFEANCPETQIQKFLNELVEDHLKVMLGNIKMSMDEIRRKAANNEIEW